MVLKYSIVIAAGTRLCLEEFFATMKVSNEYLMLGRIWTLTVDVYGSKVNNSIHPYQILFNPGNQVYSGDIHIPIEKMRTKKLLRSLLMSDASTVGVPYVDIVIGEEIT